MALSAILGHYDPSFGCEDFFRFMNWMPYIIELDFEGGSACQEGGAPFRG